MKKFKIQHGQRDYVEPVMSLDRLRDLQTIYSKRLSFLFRVNDAMKNHTPETIKTMERDIAEERRKVNNVHRMIVTQAAGKKY